MRARLAEFERELIRARAAEDERERVLGESHSPRGLGRIPSLAEQREHVAGHHIIPLLRTCVVLAFLRRCWDTRFTVYQPLRNDAN
jgi:hypothetical protein